jgi:hypothetical protein
LAALGIEEVLTAPQNPWQNPSCRAFDPFHSAGMLDPFVILGARHLRRTLTSYFDYYRWSRPLLGLGKQCPFPREVAANGRIIRIPQHGCLHNRYERIAA